MLPQRATWRSSHSGNSHRSDYTAPNLILQQKNTPREKKWGLRGGKLPDSFPIVQAFGGEDWGTCIKICASQGARVWFWISGEGSRSSFWVHFSVPWWDPQGIRLHPPDGTCSSLLWRACPVLCVVPNAVSVVSALVWLSQRPQEPLGYRRVGFSTKTRNSRVLPATRISKGLYGSVLRKHTLALRSSSPALGCVCGEGGGARSRTIKFWLVRARAQILTINKI